MRLYPHPPVLLRRALADEERGVVAALNVAALVKARADQTPDDLGGKSARAVTSALTVNADDDALTFLATIADGDARKALNALEIAALTTPPTADRIVRITHAIAEESIQKKAVVYDATGDGHYDTISAFIKSVRG